MLLESLMSLLQCILFDNMWLAIYYTPILNEPKMFYSKQEEKCIRMGIIRIYHESEGGIEKSVPRITDWHH